LEFMVLGGRGIVPPMPPRAAKSDALPVLHLPYSLRTGNRPSGGIKYRSMVS
jgi:hypothetical protein